MQLRQFSTDFWWAVRLSLLFLRFQWSIRATFKTGLLLSIVNSVIGLLSWFFIGTMFRSVQVASLANYDQSYLAYVLTGTLIASILGAGSFFSPSQFFQVGIFGADFKRWSMSPTDPLLYNLVANRVLDFVGYTLTTLLIQLVVIFGVFGFYFGVDFNLRLAMMPVVVLYLLLAAVTQIGYDLVMSSLFLHSYALRAVNQNVLANLLGTLSIVVSGQSFPIEVLPFWLRQATWLFPQAQGFIGARLLLAPPMANQASAWPHLAALLLQLLLYGGAGCLLVRSGIRRVRREGLVQVPPA